MLVSLGLCFISWLEESPLFFPHDMNPICCIFMHMKYFPGLPPLAIILLIIVS